MIKEIYDSRRQVEHQLILPVSTNLQYSIYLRKKKKARSKLGLLLTQDFRCRLTAKKRSQN